METENVIGGIFILIFYLAILLLGLYAGWRGRKKIKEQTQEQSTQAHSRGALEPGLEEQTTMLAGRNIGWIIGSFTMTATWVGGGYINGTAEAVYDSGLLWAQAPFGYSISLCLGGLFFAKIMRSRGYGTMLDPFQEKFGYKIGALLYLPSLVGDVLWSGSILAALGTTIAVIIDVDTTVSIIVSAAVIICYTLFGGLFSVAYTDVLQLVCIFFGLYGSLPFVFTNDQVDSIWNTDQQWLGKWESKSAGLWIDYAFLLIFGGIPWQVYFQRVLSSKSPNTAMGLSFLASLGCLILATPAVLLGIAAVSVKDWNAIGYEKGSPLDADESPLVLPLVIKHLTPTVVSWFGLGAVGAAVMSSSDSSILSASSIFTRNIYKLALRPRASDLELKIVIKIAIVLVGSMATCMAIKVKSIMSLFVLCSDFVYVILFPQLVCVIYFTPSNSYGSLAAYAVGLFLRLGGGEPNFDLPAYIHYPDYDEENDKQQFPFRTLAMLCSLCTLVLVSWLFQLLFTRNILPKCCDFLSVFTDQHSQKSPPTNPETLDTNSLSKEPHINSIYQMELQTRL